MDETSAIARKLQNYIEIENQPEFVQKNEPGIFKHLVLIALMAGAVFLTEITLVLVKWTRKLEG